jgi:hypothetical protein
MIEKGIVFIWFRHLYVAFHLAIGIIYADLKELVFYGTIDSTYHKPDTRPAWKKRCNNAFRRGYHKQQLPG